MITSVLLSFAYLSAIILTTALIIHISGSKSASWFWCAIGIISVIASLASFAYFAFEVYRWLHNIPIH